ncbi:MAG: hypothetical protein IJY81_06565, partial [Lachnospiraceae bacterium]|nr:hypothetical protein [Lachnospiraceae bacterium]
MDNLNLMLDSALGPMVTIADISEQEYFKYIEIETVLASELDAKLTADPHYYWQFDLIYLATQDHWGGTAIKMHNIFTGANVNAAVTYSASNDMSWKAAYELYLAVKVDKIPIILDTTSATQDYNLNVGKLALMIRQCSYDYFATYVEPHMDVTTGAVGGSNSWSSTILLNQNWWPSGYNYNNCEELGVLDKYPSQQDVLLENNVWIYRGTSAIIGTMIDVAAAGGSSMGIIKDTYPDINERPTNTGVITHGDIFRYLLNLTPSEELSRTAYILEVQPVSFFEFINHEYTDPATGTVKKAYGPVYDASGKLLNGNTEVLK